LHGTVCQQTFLLRPFFFRLLPRDKIHICLNWSGQIIIISNFCLHVNRSQSMMTICSFALWKYYCLLSQLKYWLQQWYYSAKNRIAVSNESDVIRKQLSLLCNAEIVAWHAVTWLVLELEYLWIFIVACRDWLINKCSVYLQSEITFIFKSFVGVWAQNTLLCDIVSLRGGHLFLDSACQLMRSKLQCIIDSVCCRAW